MKKVLMFVLLCAFCTVAYAEDDQAWCAKSGKLCFTPSVLVPGSHAFFDLGTDVEGEFDAFTDGTMGIDVQWIGVDAYWQALPNLRLGYLNVGYGATTGNVGAPEVTFTIGSFIQLKDALRFEVGVVKALTSLESEGRIDDTAIFVGISFPTNFGDALKRIFTQ